MKDLKERVQAMLDGETKRREVALKFLEEVKEILTPVGSDIWGEQDYQNAVWISRESKDNKREYTDIYFRYKIHIAETKDEYEGFYFSDKGIPFWGKEIRELKGSDFWSAIGDIINWIPYVAKLMENRSISREELLKKINL